MYEANGFTGTPDIKFETGIGGEEGTDGARGTETGTIYFDIEKIKDAMSDEKTGGTGVLIGLIAHESSHSEKYGETTGNLLIEEGFADSKEELARDKFKETDKTLSEEEKEKALAKIKDEVKDERAISDSLTISSEDEPVENALVWDDGAILIGTGIALTHKYLYETSPEYKELINTGILKFEKGRVYLRGKLIEGFEWTIENISNLISSASTTNSKESVKEEEKDKKEETKGNTNKDKE